jgi:hypothetical protein
MFTPDQRAILLGLGFVLRHPSQTNTTLLTHRWENFDYPRSGDACVLRVGARGPRLKNLNVNPAHVDPRGSDTTDAKFWVGNPSSGAVARCHRFPELIAAIATVRLTTPPAK